MKTKIDTVNATPSKRVFLSIIADYDLERSICELVDNALDVWTRAGRKRQLEIRIDLDSTQQTIRVEDNAGGLPQSDLSYVVAPGQTGLSGDDTTIGIFGVGTKRAVVALAQDVKITTRHRKGSAHRVEFDDSWLNDDDDWQLPVYEVDDIPHRHTIIDLARLRSPVDNEVATRLKHHLGTTYAYVLKDAKLTLSVGSDLVTTPATVVLTCGRYAA